MVIVLTAVTPAPGTVCVKAFEFAVQQDSLALHGPHVGLVGRGYFTPIICADHLVSRVTLGPCSRLRGM